VTSRTVRQQAEKIMNDEPTLADDLIEGAENIGAHYGKGPRWAYPRLEKGEIPGFKLAGKWHSRRSSIRADIERRERGGGAS